MTTRITYVVILVLAALIMMTLDQLYVEETSWQKHLSISREVTHLAKTVTSFFRERTGNVTAVANLVATQGEDEQAGIFASASQTFIASVPGSHSVVLLDEDFSVLASYPQHHPTGLKLDEIFPDAGAVRNAVIRAQKEKEAVVFSNSIHSNERQADFFVACPVASESGNSRRMVVADFDLAPLTQNYFGNRMDRGGRLSALLIAPSGKDIVSNKDPEESGLHQTQNVVAGSDVWRVRVQQTHRDRTMSTLARGFLWILGLTLTAGFLFFYSTLVRRNRQLQRKEVELEAQASATREYNERLLKTNRDLDDFTYVVSHDLKEPLRGIEGLTNLMIADYGERLDDTAREYLQFIKGAAGRLQHLIQDLLKLSRATRHDYPHEMTDMGELANEVIESMQYAITEKGVKVIVETPMPSVSCNRIRMAEVYQNLLSNAIKFTNGKPPCIRIGYRDLGEKYLFWVDDNGIGVRPEHRERIFSIFQRVHTDVQQEGTGVGLTICARIIERHGGRIWVESGTDGGSRFCFIIPKEPVFKDTTDNLDLPDERNAHPQHLECTTC